MNDSDLEPDPSTFHHVIPCMPERVSTYALFDVPYQYDCDECCDVAYVKVVDRYKITDFKTKMDREVEGHYYRPCSRCRPERYRIMIQENHGRAEHRDKGGCSTCKKYL